MSKATKIGIHIVWSL